MKKDKETERKTERKQRDREKEMKKDKETEIKTERKKKERVREINIEWLHTKWNCYFVQQYKIAIF
jgi:hypothetical protein